MHSTIVSYAKPSDHRTMSDNISSDDSKDDVPVRYSIPIISVVAVTPSWGIGHKGTLPWHTAGKSLPKDLGR